MSREEKNKKKKRKPKHTRIVLPGEADTFAARRARNQAPPMRSQAPFDNSAVPAGQTNRQAGQTGQTNSKTGAPPNKSAKHSPQLFDAASAKIDTPEEFDDNGMDLFFDKPVVSKPPEEDSFNHAFEPEEEPAGSFLKHGRKKVEIQREGNAIHMPKVNPMVEEMRRKRRLRKVRKVVVLLAALLTAFVFVSGLYMNIAVTARNMYDSFRINTRSGGGYPMEFSLSGYFDAQGMNANGFAVLGEKDMAFVSASGNEIRRV